MYLGPSQYTCLLLRALLSNFPKKDVLVCCLLYWFQNCSVLSAEIGEDEEDTEELDEGENVETDEDLDLNEWLDNLYFPFNAADENPDPGEKDFVLVFVGLISAGVEQLLNAIVEDVDEADEADIEDDLDLNLC